MSFSRHLRQTMLVLGFGLSAFLFLFTAVAPATAQAGATAVVTAPAANLRTGPGAGYPTILTTYQGYALAMVGRTDDAQWLKVRTSGNQIEGWIATSAISTAANIGALPVSAVPTLPYTAVITAGAVNLRAGDTTQYKVLAVLQSGTQVALVGRNSAASWVQVRVVNTGQVGWINATTQSVENIGFLPVVAPPPLTDDTVQQPPTLSGPNALVTAGNLNVRQGPGIGFARVGSVSYGQVVQMTGRASNSSWVVINANGLVGWVNSYYMQFNYDLNALPVVATGNTPSSPSEPTDPPQIVQPIVGYLTANTTLNVRYGPGLGYQAFGLLYSGQQAEMLARSADSQWVKIRDANGTQGWVYAYYTTPTVPVANLPVATQ